MSNGDASDVTETLVLIFPDKTRKPQYIRHDYAILFTRNLGWNVQTHQQTDRIHINPDTHQKRKTNAAGKNERKRLFDLQAESM